MKTLSHLFSAGFCLLLCLLAGTVLAQDLPGVRDSLFSEVLQEKRFIQVILPPNYQPGSADKYDVVYVLDGEWQTKLMSQILPYVEQEGYMPANIIVSVFNVDRNRDFLPSKMDNLPTSGGADKFLTFLKSELIPYVNKTYPANGENTLFGASFGGVFAMHAFLNDPAVFASYIASDPAFWWDNQFMQKMALEKLQSLQGVKNTFYISGREGGDYAHMGIAAMDSIFRDKAPQGLKWKFLAYENETHNSVNFKTMYDGLKFSYAGYSKQSIDFHPMNGIVLKDKPIKLWCFSNFPDIRYTTDGNEPTEASPKMEQESLLAGPAEVKARSFSSRSRYDNITVGQFKEGKALSPKAKPRKAVSGGFRYAYYEGVWDSLPDFKKLKPVLTGLAGKEFNVQTLPRETNFACLIEGYLDIQEEGYYIFGIDSDDGSRLYVGDQLLINYDGLHGDGNAKSYIVPLKKGFYPLRLEYFQKEGGRGLNLIYLPPNTNEPRPIPLELQYSRR